MNLHIDTKNKIIQVMDNDINLRDLFEWLNNHIKDWGNYTLDRPDKYNIKDVIVKKDYSDQIVHEPYYVNSIYNSPPNITCLNGITEE